MLRAAARSQLWDVMVIGGGATGLGCALDAALRGYSTILVEAYDFGSGTSSRSTKIIHGGIRYLRQLQLGFVREGLKERELLFQIAPHLVRTRQFIIPFYSRCDAAAFTMGVALYKRLAGRGGRGDYHVLSAGETARALPSLRTERLKGGIAYQDGQFDDARYLIALAQSAARAGATLLNYCPVVDLLRGDRGGCQEPIRGARVLDVESNQALELRAKVVVNAAGPFADGIRAYAGANNQLLTVSRGAHVVFDSAALQSESALVIPRTVDGRVMFLLPWRDKVIAGTTDHRTAHAEPNIAAERAEVREIISTVRTYVQDVGALDAPCSSFAGLRPLIAHQGGNTARLSRDFSVVQEFSTLLTVVGGKWTTYRKMAEAAIDRAATIGGLPPVESSTTETALYGASGRNTEPRFEGYGSAEEAVRTLEKEQLEYSEPLVLGRPESVGQVVYGIRFEMARRIEDVFARRLRVLPLDVTAAAAAVPKISAILGRELGKTNGTLSLDEVHARALCAATASTLES